MLAGPEKIKLLVNNFDFTDQKIKKCKHNKHITEACINLEISIYLNCDHGSQMQESHDWLNC